MIHIGDELKKYRKIRNLTQQQVDSLLGLSRDESISVKGLTENQNMEK